MVLNCALVTYIMMTADVGLQMQFNVISQDIVGLIPQDILISHAHSKDGGSG